MLTRATHKRGNINQITDNVYLTWQYLQNVKLDLLKSKSA